MQVLCSMAARLLPWAVMLTAGAVAYSCADDDIIKGGLSSEIIEFNASISDNVSSRSSIDSISERKCLSVRRIEGCDSLYIHTIISDLNMTPDIQSRASQKTDMSEYGSFGVTAYAFDGNWEESIAGAEKHLDNVKVEQKDDGLWDAGAACRWPVGEKSVKFAAYAPYNAESGATPQITDNGISLSYSTNAGASKQMDLIVASAEYSGPAESVNLSFKHALTAVKFETGDDFIPGTISRITFKNVLAGGVYSYDTKTWTPSGDVSDFTLAMNKELDGTPNQSVNDGENIFMFMPQTLPENAELEVMYKDKITETTRTFTVTLNGTIWPMGKEVVYRLSTTSISIIPHITVSLSKKSVEYVGGTINLTVKSYADYTAEGEQVVTKAVPWTLEAEDESGDWTTVMPDWLSSVPSTGIGSTFEKSYTIKISAIDPKIYDNHRHILRDAAPKGSDASPFDLSMHDVEGNPNPSGMTTANCYVVSSPGTYMFPLVYGNAVKNGASNTASYTRSSKPSNGLKTLVRHDHEPVASPFIENNYITVTNAKLKWNDVGRNFVKDVGLLSVSNTIDGGAKELKYIKFTIPQESISQGNALIVATNSSGEIVWSWHIWVTDQCNTTETIYNYHNDTYDMLTVNLGWVKEYEYVYPERKQRLRLTQRGTDSGGIVEIVQSSHRETRGCNPGYQWGRKDPFPLGTHDENEVPVLYDDNGIASNVIKAITTTKAQSLIGYAIQTPTTIRLYSTTTGPYASTAYNLWNMSNNTTFTKDSKITTVEPTMTKTIYDPCPPGYTVAGANAFSGFTTTGKTTTSEANINAETYKNGWYFSTGYGNRTIFFPATGGRNVTGDIYGVGSLYNPADGYSYSWTAYPGSTKVGRSLRATVDKVGPTFENERWRVLPVRPCREN